MDESREIRTDPRPPLLSIVMPVFREGAQLAGFLSAVRSGAQQCNLPYELLLIDDGSPDDTWQGIEAEITSGRLLRALRLSRNFGKESALCAGLEHAQGDAVIVLDADGQHPPPLIREV